MTTENPFDRVNGPKTASTPAPFSGQGPQGDRANCSERRENAARLCFRPLSDLVNSSPDTAAEPILGLANAIPANDAENPPEWLEVPYGEVPIHLGKVDGIQRLNRSVADRLVEWFHGWRGQLANRFGGVPVYKGHPDSSYFRERGDTDEDARGWIRDVSAGDAALRLQVEWNPDGLALLANKVRKFFSPFFRGAVVGRENGVTIYEPMALQSVGLVNNPNWPVAPLVNAGNPDGHAAVNSQEGGSMTLLQRLLALIGQETVKTEDDMVNHVTGLVNEATRLAAAHTELANQVAADATELQTAQAALAAMTEQRQAERGARVELLVNAAVADGRVTPAEREGLVTDLVNAEDIAPKLTELANRKPALKTKPVTRDLGRRDADVHTRREQALALVNKRMADTGDDYETAFAVVQKENPALFDKKGE